MTFQPAPRKCRFQFRDDLPVAADRAVQPLQVAVDDEDEVVQLLARGQRDRAERSRARRFRRRPETPRFCAELRE